MIFFNRDTEKETLENIKAASLKKAQMTILVGRRRIGKTRLLLDFFHDKPHLYLFCSKKPKDFLAEEFLLEVKDKLGIPIYGRPGSAQEIIKILFDYAKKQQLTVILDEVQNFLSIDRSFFSDLQKLWDLNKDASKLNLILCGSVYSLISKIFLDKKEPLFGRANHFLTIKPFAVKSVIEVLQSYKIFSNDNLIDFFILTGGVPKYLEYFLENNVKGLKSFVQKLITPDSLILSEGKSLFIEEFGKDYSTYFTILQLISEGYTSRSRISSFWNGKKELGGFLKRLETDFNLITKSNKVSPKKTKDVRYKIDDFFLTFWFRFIYKNQRIIESGNILHLQEIILRDWPSFRGKLFERVAIQILKESKKYSYIGAWWDRKGENEIDIVAVDELNKTILIGECKLNHRKINLEILQKKSQRLIGDYPEYKVEYKAFYPEMIDTTFTTSP